MPRKLHRFKELHLEELLILKASILNIINGRVEQTTMTHMAKELVTEIDQEIEERDR